MNRTETLSELRHTIYNAEDEIDGIYNSNDEDFNDLVEINERYNKLLVDMNKLIDIINNELIK